MAVYMIKLPELTRKDEKCENCLFYDAESSECRGGLPDSHGGWPQVKPSKWCGEWRLNETLEKKQPVQAQQAVAEPVEE